MHPLLFDTEENDPVCVWKMHCHLVSGSHIIYYTAVGAIVGKIGTNKDKNKTKNTFPKNSPKNVC